MSKLEKKLGELLNEINQICSDAGITYFLYGRTLAEALLYEGFCPEKCDRPKNVNICMLSGDFDKFKNLIANNNIENRVLDGFDMDEDSTVMGGRYIDTSMAYSTEPYNISGKTSGVYIDITVIDTVSGDEETFSNYALDLAYLNDVIDPATDYGIDVGVNAKNIISSGMRVKKNLTQSKTNLEEGEEQNIQEWLLPRSGHLIEPLTRDVFVKGRTASFLGDEYPAPKQSVRLLIALYGDEWETAAFKESETALFAPLSKATDMNGGILSQKEFVKSLKNRKLWLAKNAELLSEVRASMRQLTSTQVEVNFDDISKDKSKIEELIQLESAGKHIKLSNILADYLSAQASDTFITDKTWPVSLLPEEHDTIIEMHPAIVYVGLKTLMSTGNVYKARRILEEFIKTGEPLPKKTEDLIDIIDDMREAMCLADEGNINEAIRLASKVIKKDPYNVCMLSLLAKKMAMNAEERKDVSLVQGVIERLKEVSRDDGSIDKIEGDFAYKKDRRLAYSKYFAALNKTNDSRLKAEIERIMRDDYNRILIDIEKEAEISRSKAISLAEKMLTVFGPDETLIVTLYELKFEMSRNNKDLKELEQDLLEEAKEVSGDKAQIRDLLKKIYIKMGDNDNTAYIRVETTLEEDYDKLENLLLIIDSAISKKPNEPKFSKLLGDVYMKLGLISTAFDSYYGASALSPDKRTKEELRDIFITNIEEVADLMNAKKQSEHVREKARDFWDIIHPDWDKYLKVLRSLGLLGAESMQELRGDDVRALIADKPSVTKLALICRSHYDKNDLAGADNENKVKNNIKIVGNSKELREKVLVETEVNVTKKIEETREDKEEVAESEKDFVIDEDQFLISDKKEPEEQAESIAEKEEKPETEVAEEVRLASDAEQEVKSESEIAKKANSAPETKRETNGEAEIARKTEKDEDGKLVDEPVPSKNDKLEIENSDDNEDKETAGTEAEEDIQVKEHDKKKFIVTDNYDSEEEEKRNIEWVYEVSKQKDEHGIIRLSSVAGSEDSEEIEELKKKLEQDFTWDNEEQEKKDMSKIKFNWDEDDDEKGDRQIINTVLSPSNSKRGYQFKFGEIENVTEEEYKEKFIDSASDDETGEEQNDADETDYIPGDGGDGDGEESKTPKDDNDDEKGKVINFSESIAKKKD